VTNKLMKRILIIEDEAIVRESMRDWLTEGGYIVETAIDGEQALKAIPEHDFDLVLLDLRLPGKNGIEVLKESRKIRPNLKVVIITGYPSVETAVQAMKQGAIDYLPKPLDLVDLEKLIEGTLTPQASLGEKDAPGESVAKVTVIKNKEGVNLTLTGWEYIDSYLNS